MTNPTQPDILDDSYALHLKGDIEHHFSTLAIEVRHSASSISSEEQTFGESLYKTEKKFIKHDTNGIILYRHRKLQQYLDGHILVKSTAKRTISMDELFLDLIIVASVATLSHMLRYGPSGIDYLEFVLIFAIIWLLWRDIAFIWNQWGTYMDWVDWKLTFVEAVCILVIVVSSNHVFDYASHWAAAGGAIGNALLAVVSVIFGIMERDLPSNSPTQNPPVLFGVLMIPAIALLVAAAIVTDHDTVLGLYGAATIYGFLRFLIGYFMNLLFFKPQFRGAVNTELVQERFSLLTLIVLGETVLTLTLEASSDLKEEFTNSIIGYVILVLMATYSFHGFYFRIDNKILHGSRHAVKDHIIRGLVWTSTHFFCHVALISAAAGAGGLLDDYLYLKANEAKPGYKAGSETVDYDRKIKTDAWLLCGGWGSTLILFSILNLCHVKSLSNRSRDARLAFRSLLGIVIITMPLYLINTRVSFLGVIGIASGLIAFCFNAEYVVCYFADHQISKRMKRGETPEIPEYSLSDSTGIAFGDIEDKMGVDLDGVVNTASEIKHRLTADVGYFVDNTTGALFERVRTCRGLPEMR